MIDLKDIDVSAPYLAQLEGPDDGHPVTLVNTFLAPEGQVDKLIDVWRQDSLVMKKQPGFVSAQLYCGIAGNRALTNVAVWENLSSLRDAFMNEEFQNTRTLYPAGSVSQPVVMRAVAVPGVCVA